MVKCRLLQHQERPIPGGAGWDPRPVWMGTEKIKSPSSTGAQITDPDPRESLYRLHYRFVPRTSFSVPTLTSDRFWFDVHRAVHRNIISIVKPTRCTYVSNLILFLNDTLHVLDGFRPSSGVQDCIYSNKHLSNMYGCLLVRGYPLASRQQYLLDKCLLLYVQSWTPDHGRKDPPKHVECHSKNKTKFYALVHLVGFIIEIIW